MSTTIPTILSTIVLVTMVAASDHYAEERERILAEERAQFFGAHQNLSSKELLVNEILLEAKEEELKKAYEHPSDFLPSLHFFQAKSLIDQSRVFSIIRKAPKGGSLHTHLLAAAAVDFIVQNFTYRENLYGGRVNGVFKLIFLQNATQDDRCRWTKVEDMRREDPDFDAKLRANLTLNVDDPRRAYPNAKAVWGRFKNTFTTVYELLAYKPVFEEYIGRVLQELHDDNVTYVELKGTAMRLYELDGSSVSVEEFFEIFMAAVGKFKETHPRFVGVRFIYSIYRGATEAALKSELEQLVRLKGRFPDFIAGLDLVGFEEDGKLLREFHSQLSKYTGDFKLFLHAGETNWFGHTDLNLVDAILLNSSRIGHGFAITKHSTLLKLAQDRNIALEVCPISNQVLMLNDDPRNHPAATLMAMNYPVVVCNDDPSVWNATGLSYDFYVVFMAMTPRTSGLEVIKQLAVNSIDYSAMEEEEKNRVKGEWNKQWDEFLDEMLATEKKPH